MSQEILTKRDQIHDLAITNAQILTMDDARTVIEAGTVLVTDGRIVHVGGSVPHRAKHTIDAGGAIVMPGLVNAHTHLAMTMFRGTADDLDLDGFLDKLLPAEAAVLDEATVAAATELAVAECLMSGITSALDMYFFPEAARAVAEATGFELHHGPVFLAFEGPDRRPFAQRLEWAATVLDQPTGVGSAKWVQPHSTYLLSDEQLRAVAELADAHGARVHVHACETAVEITRVLAEHGRRPIQVLADTGLLTERTVLAHGVHLDATDVDLIAASGASVAHNPASNLKLASGVAPVAELLARGVNVALGTDGPASGNDLDLWIAMRLAAYVQKATSHDPRVLPAATLVHMATRGGARALGIDAGSIEVGRRGDLVVLDANAPALTPVYDPHSTVAYAATRAEVRHVVVAGRVLVDDRQLTTIDIDAAVAAVRAISPRIRAALS